MSAPSPSSGFAVLRNRNFASDLSARVLGTLAVQMQSVAIGWQVYEITGNLFDLGLIGLAQFAPVLALILFAGHAADRYNRRNIIAIGMGVQLLCSLLLLGFTLSGSHVVWPVFAILVLFGSARAFMMPATQAIVKNMVPLDRGRVSAVSSVFIGASNELGEFESGLTARWFGLVRAILLGGAATLAVTGIWALLFPVLSRMDRFPHHAADKAAA